MNILFLVHIEPGMKPCMPLGYPERVAEIVDAAEYDRVYHKVALSMRLMFGRSVTS